MKKKKMVLGLIMATSAFLLSGCGENQQIPDIPSTPNTSQKEDNNGEQYSIYLLAVNSGYNGTYEEWLESIRGDVIVLNLTESNILQWKYSLESDDKYRTLLDLSTLRGPKGDTGNGIKSVEKTSSDGLIDTYTITFTDGTTSTFNVTNGATTVDDGIIRDVSVNVYGEKYETIFDIVKDEVTSIKYMYNGDNFIPVSKSHKKYKCVMNNRREVLSESYNWSNEKEMWIGSSKNEYSFDEKGRYTLFCQYSWSNDIDEWIYTDKTETTYDDENSIRVGISYSWNYENKKWVPTQKYERVQLTDDIYSEADYRWSQETNEWAGYSKRECNENYETIASYSWDYENKKWVGIGQKQMGYLDEETQQYIVDVYEWSSGLDDWLIKKKTVSSNLETIEFSYKWTDDQKSTINYQKKETVLDSSYRKPLSEITYVWSTEANDWLYSSKNEHEYCSYDKETYSASYYWSTSENKWIGLHKEEHEYNSNGRETMHSSYNWSTETNDWVGTDKSTFVPDDLSDYGWIEQITYGWSTETNDWVKDRKYEYSNGYQIAEYYWSTETNDWIQVDN